VILSGADVKQYILHGGLKFTPALQEIQFQQNGVDLVLEGANVQRLGVSEFTLGRTREQVTLPNDLMAFVQLRSSWARRGFMLPPTVADAGFNGTITLEIVKFGSVVDLPFGERFAHLIFAKLTSPSEPYSGRYQGQHEITGAYE
jgi:dCTP deaminase